MTLPANIHQLLHRETLAGNSRGVSGGGNQKLGRHHATVEPVNLSTSANSADHADIAASGFERDVCDEVFLQTKGVDSWNIFFPNSHSHPLICGAFVTTGNPVHLLTHVASELSPAPALCGDMRFQVDSRCSDLGTLPASHPYNPPALNLLSQIEGISA